MNWIGKRTMLPAGPNMACASIANLSIPCHETLINNLKKGIAIMSGKTDVVKGRIKEAAGALTGNDKLREEGKTDQAVGKTKQAVHKAVTAVENAAANVVDKVKNSTK
jgi:uncharacterized protein YjbJ (UPF0337 family)